MEIYERINKLFGSSYESNYGINLYDLFSGRYELSDDLIHRIVSCVSSESAFLYVRSNIYYLLSSYPKLSEALIYRYRSKLNWGVLCSKVMMSVEFLDRMSKYVDWDNVSRYQKLDGWFIEKYHLNLNWDYISTYQKLDECLIDMFSDRVNWYFISVYQRLSEDFIERHADKVDWVTISYCQRLSEGFIKRHADKVDWWSIFAYQRLSDGFIGRFVGVTNCYDSVVRFKSLSEEFIESNFSELSSRYLCMYQRLSEDFIERHADVLDFRLISIYQHLSDSFIGRYRDRLDMYEIALNWNYKSVEEKKRLLVDTCKYECHDDYFIAYKAVREDGHSLFNFQYKYEKGGIYESWCDCTEDENSFGLNVGTYSEAVSYGDVYVMYRIVRCKVRYEDIGRIVHGGNKVRCFKIEVLD